MIICISGKEVAKIFTQVSVTKREAEIRLDDSDFNERKEINKRKKLILEGKDPDEELRKREEQRKQKLKQYKARMRKKLKEKRNKFEGEARKNDVYSGDNSEDEM